MIGSGELPKEWFEDIADPEARVLFERYILGLARLPPAVVQQVQDVMDDPAKGDLDTLRVLSLHHLEHGGDTTALVALTKLLSAEIEKAGRGRELEALAGALSDEFLSTSVRRDPPKGAPPGN